MVLKACTRARALQLPLAAAVVVLSRLPFLGAGYGVDPDAWLVVRAGRGIAASGHYVTSRFPGYPVQEFVSSLTYHGGPWVANGCTALLSVVAAIFFALSVKALGARDYALAGLALAFTPIVFINSVNLLDYVWALSFMMGSLYFVLLPCPLLAGMFLGLAAACRITSLVALIPLGLMLSAGKRKDTLRNILKVALAASIVAAAAFFPVVLEYGPRFFRFYEGEHDTSYVIIRRATEHVWGRVGLLAMAGAALGHILSTSRARAATAIPPDVPRAYVAAWLLAIGLELALYLRLPSEAGYLIPAVPFTLLLLGRWLTRRAFVACCMGILLSPFVGLGRAGPYPGPVLLDRAYRLSRMKLVADAVAAANELPDRSLVVAGGWLPQIEEVLDSTRSPNHKVTITSFTGLGEEIDPGATVVTAGRSVEYVHLPDSAQLERYLRRGYRIYYLPEQREKNLAVRGVDLHGFGGIPLLPQKGDP